MLLILLGVVAAAIMGAGVMSRNEPLNRPPLEYELNMATVNGGHSPEAVFDRLLKYTISEDGRLHGEKYFQTTQEEFRTTRPAFRWRQLIGLARVTASAYGYYDREDHYGRRAPGYEEACRLLKVTA